MSRNPLKGQYDAVGQMRSQLLVDEDDQAVAGLKLEAWPMFSVE